MNFRQEEKFTDIVIPLIRANKTENGEVEYEELFGTAFLIGQNGFAITCAHVIDQLHDGLTENQILITHFPYKGQIYPFELVNFEKHENQDVGIFQVKGPKLSSWLKVLNSHENSSMEYHGWGYPRETAKELKLLDPNAFEYPELIFTQGYIRRRIDRELYPTFIYKGNSFYEVSDLGGSGYSGSPIIKKSTVGQKVYGVIGIYVGEKEGEGVPVGYVVNSECFANWAPKVLGKTILEECG